MEKDPEITKRLIEAFGTNEPNEIYHNFGLNYQTAKNYVVEGRIPQLDRLVEISDLTGYSIHYIMKGEGPRRVKTALLARVIEEVVELLDEAHRLEPPNAESKNADELGLIYARENLKSLRAYLSDQIKQVKGVGNSISTPAETDASGAEPGQQEPRRRKK